MRSQFVRVVEPSEIGTMASAGPLGISFCLNGHTPFVSYQLRPPRDCGMLPLSLVLVTQGETMVTCSVTDPAAYSLCCLGTADGPPVYQGFSATNAGNAVRDEMP